MTIQYERQSFDPSCPAGGSFFACGYGSMFVGCCTGNDPCSDAGCSAGELQPASFTASAYGTFADQLCSAGSQWYTCAGDNPPFMGCCQSNACSNNGCPAQDLTPGILQSVAALNSAYDPISDPSATSNVAASSASAPVIISTTTGVTLSHTSSTGSLSSMSISTAAAAASSSSTPQNITSQYSSGPPTAAIAGGVVGGLAVLALLIGLLLWYCRRNVRSSRRHMDDSRAFSSAAGLAAGDDAACVEKPSPSVYTYQTPDSLKAPPHSAAISPAPLAYNHPAELHNESSPVPSFQGFPSPPRSPYGLGVSNRDELHMGEAERFMTVSPGLSMGSPGPYRDVEVSELDSGGGGAGTSR